MTDEYRNFLTDFVYPGWGVDVNESSLSELQRFMELDFPDRVERYLGVKPLNIGHVTSKVEDIPAALIVSHFDTSQPVNGYQLERIYQTTMVRLWEVDWVEIGHMHENEIPVGISVIDMDQEWLRYGMTWLVAKRY